jgi:lysophospholipase L1-like esterase
MGSSIVREGAAGLLSIGLLTLVVGGCGGGGSHTGPSVVASDNPRVSAIGDSITAGSRAGQRPYPVLLQALLRGRNRDALVVNRGVGGQKTGAGIGSVQQALDADNPGFVLIMEGSNDVDGERPTDVTVENLRTMVMLVKNHGSVAVLGTIPPQVGPRAGFMGTVIELNDKIRRLSGEQRVTLADVFAALPDASFMDGDGLHPNDRGDAAIAATFDAALSQAGYPTARLIARRP